MNNTTGQLDINFIGRRNTAFAISFLLIILSIGSLFYQGLALGIDFTGGYLLEASFSNPVDLYDIRKSVIDAGYTDSQIQYFGTKKDILVRVGPQRNIKQAELSTHITSILQSKTNNPATLRRIEYVGPRIGEELREQGGMAMLISLFGILIYVGLRFQLKSAAAAILALLHDVIITIGVFSIFRIEFDLTVLAAILAVIGYSLNDTVVVLDRIRETFRTNRKGSNFDHLNSSINQTLSRTVITSLTTLLVLIALFLYGGQVIHGFAFALIIGVFIGTYSSIYVASSALAIMKICREDFYQDIKEDGKDDLLP